MPDDDLTGQTIRGYELHEPIGAGGFGAVYRAYQAAVRREVAIKIILPQFASEPEFIRRFEAEAQIVARLEHPYIVPLYDYWRDPSGAYLVMRWLSGGSLRGLLRQERLPLDHVGKLLDQIGGALGLAHRRGVIHRDLKPDNVLLDDERNAYLADFGIAKDVPSPHETAGGELIITGTPTYIAPEQIMGAPITPRTDIYSLGVMLYELLTGDPPFARLSLSELLQKHLYETLPPLVTQRADLPNTLNAVIQTATAKAPAESYPGAPEMAAAFQQAVGASGTSQTGDSSATSAATPRVPRTPLRRPRDTPRLANTPTITPDMPTITPADERAQLASPDTPTATPDRALAAPIIPRSPLVKPTVTPADEQAALFQDEPDNPYKGLRAFEEADAADFFGRETLLEQLIAQLRQREAGSRFLAVVGPSGSGKSSAVKAGLIPALRNGALPGSDRGFVVEMTPGAAPFDELADALQRISTTSSVDLGAQLRRDSNGLLNAVQNALPADNRVELTLVIDQFEELYTLPTDPTVCAKFLDILLTAVTTPDSRVRVIVTLRADFYDRPLLYPGFGELVRKRTEVVLPLDTDSLRRAIALPAERAGLTLEAGLIEEILSDVVEQPGALPLIQYALTELFERREGRTLTLLAYRESGGVIGALARRADALYAGLMPDDQAVARQVFLRLVTPSEGVEDTRRRALRPELSIAADDDERVEAILNRFGQYRLLTFDRDPTTRIPTIEIAHEALIRTWGRLRDWVAASRDDLVIQRRLSAAVAEWRIAGHDPGFLATEARLTQFESWAAATALALSRDESNYLRTSIAERDARQARDDTRKAREAAIARRAQTFGRTAAVLGIVGVLAVIATIVAVLQAANAHAEVSHANDQLDIAAQTLTPVPATLTPVSLTLAAGNALIIAARATGTFAANQIVSVQIAANSVRALTDPNGGPETAILLAIHALHTAYSPEADAALTNALNNQFAIRQLSGHTDSVTSVAVSPDGQYVLSGSNDGTARLWDLQTGAQIRVLSGHSGHVLGVAFSPDGKTALTGGNDKTARLWEVSTGKELRELNVGTAVLTVAFSPDGTQILTGQDNKIAQVWDAQSGASIRTLTGHKDAVFAVAF
ncbi:MAG: nSTAND1 domain-containing NTPase [Aggregatilineales bacterium]